MGVIFASAQRIGEWRSVTAARWLTVAGASMSVAWCFVFLPSRLAWIFSLAIGVVMLVIVAKWIKDGGKAVPPQQTGQITTQPSEQPEEEAIASSPVSDGKLRFGVHNRVDIGPGLGNQAELIAIENIERGYEYRCHGLKAELTFTHVHTKEAFKKPGWFASIDNGKISALPVESASLSSKDHNLTWLILYINNVPKGQFWFGGPQLELTPLMESFVLTHENQRLSYGRWQLKITITTDGPERLERTVQVQAG